MKVCVLFERLGPYHHARLAAFSKFVQLLAIEIYRKDATYDWDEVQQAVSYEKVTLQKKEQNSSRLPRRFKRDIAEQLDRFLPEVVAVPGWSQAWALTAMALCEDRGIPVVIMSASTRADFKRSEWIESLKSKLLSFAGAYLAGGTRQKEYLMDLGISSGLIFPAYDSVDNSFFKKGAMKARKQAGGLRKQLSLPSKFFLSSFRFIHKKNASGLLRAYASYARGRRSAWKLVLLGDGPECTQIEKQIQSLRLRDSVFLAGFRQYEELPVFYGLASAFILPSFSEQWGLVVNEAMAAGLPVLVSKKCGCAADLVEEGNNGYTFDPGNTNELSALMKTIETGRHRTSMARRGQQIIKGWSPRSFSENLKKACTKALNVPVKKQNKKNRLLLRLLACKPTGGRGSV